MRRFFTATIIVAVMTVAMTVSVQEAVLATSAQMELSEPVLPVAKDKTANGTAFFGWVGGGDVYNTTGNLGGTFPLGEIKRGKLYFFADLFTWIENPNSSRFRPKRVIYTLEPGYNYVLGDSEYRFFIKHQSYHDVDFADNLEESYELYGLNYRLLRRPELQLRVAKYVNRRVVDYDWDLAASATFDLPSNFGRQAYIHGWIHHVTESGNSFGRSNFTDYAAEFGFTVNAGLTLFARYEYLHDLERFGARSDHHVLVGPKYVW